MSTPEFASAPFTAGQLNALVKIIGPENVPGILNRSLRFVLEGSAPLLKRITSIAVSAIQRFVARDCLKSANVGWTGNNFDKLFRYKVEKNVSGAKLAVSRLGWASLDDPILAELGDKAEVSLAHIFGLLKKQAYGEEGVLLTNGYANIFYVRDTNGILWAVNANRNSDNRCWLVEAYSVEIPSRWRVGDQVFSRDS